MMRFARHRAALAVALAAIPGGVFVPGLAFAQAGPPTPARPRGRACTPVAPTPGGTYVPMQTQPGQQVGGFGNPQSPNGTIGGGNATESSAHPVTGDEEDSFDFGKRRRGAGAVHGDRTAPSSSAVGAAADSASAARRPTRTSSVAATRSGASAATTSRTRTSGRASGRITPRSTTRTGSTRATRCGSGAGGPDAATARRPAAGAALPGRGHDASSTGGGRCRTAPSSCATRDGSATRTTRCGATSRARTPTRCSCRTATRSTCTSTRGTTCTWGRSSRIFKPAAHLGGGHDRADRRARRASTSGTRRTAWRARRIVESLNVIERGAKVGPLTRRVRGRPAAAQRGRRVDAHVLASLHPNEFFGQNQVVFIDKGEDDGPEGRQPPVGHATAATPGGGRW